MAGILSGLGKGIIGAGAAIGQGIAGLKTPAEKEAERLKNEALSISGELGKLNLSGIKAKQPRDAQLATQTAQTAGQARDFISGFQNKLADAREGEGFEAFNDEEEIKRLALKDRLGSGVLGSQIFKENLTQLPSGIAQNKQVQDFQTTLTNAEAPIISEADKLKREIFEGGEEKRQADLNKVKFETKKIGADIKKAQEAVKDNFTPAQGKIAGAALRLEESEKVLKQLEKEGFDPSSVKTQFFKADFFNSIKDPQMQRYMQAARNVVSAILREESGAAINAGEYLDGYRLYFAQLGDKNASIAQKRDTRLQKLAGFTARSGGALQATRDTYNVLRNQKSREENEAQSIEQPVKQKEQITEDDIQTTMKENGWTRQQVEDKIKGI